MANDERPIDQSTAHLSFGNSSFVITTRAARLAAPRWSMFVSVRIRMKKMGRSHQPFFRICAVDKHRPRDGRVLEELGTYDPCVSETDARALLRAERIDYWISVGAQPSDNVKVLIKKYGTNGTHRAAQQAALEKLGQPRSVPDPGAPASLPKPKMTKAEAAAAANAEAAATASAEAASAEAEPVAAEAGVETAEASAE
jgi:small subunit ribosomal protein S16